jgi:hypothetical protein
VFHVAEPLTETKELRRISREISRPVQFRVLKRENQICSSCGESVQDGDIHFDHIIPFSKGGSSDENNVRLLCDTCNTKRGNRFETEYLVTTFVEHVSEHLDLGILDLLKDVVDWSLRFRVHNKRFPSAKEVSEAFHDGTVSPFEENMAKTAVDLDEFFRGKKPEELTRNHMRILKKRWGFQDGKVHPLASVSEEKGEDVGTMVILERSLLARAGWFVKEDKHTRRKWEKR